MNRLYVLAYLSFLPLCPLSGEQEEVKVQTVNSTPYYQYYYEQKPKTGEQQSATYYYYYPDTEQQTEWRWELKQAEPQKKVKPPLHEQRERSQVDEEPSSRYWEEPWYEKERHARSEFERRERKTDAPAYDKLMRDLQQHLEELKREKEQARPPQRQEPKSDVPTYEELMRDIQRYLEHEKSNRSDRENNAIQRYIDEEERRNPPSRDSYFRG